MSALRHIEDPNASSEKPENAVTYCGERVRRSDCPLLILEKTGLIGDSDCDDCLDAYFAFITSLYDPDDD